MPADQDHVLAPPRQHGDDVGHRQPAVGRVGVERFHPSRDPGPPKLVDDVLARSRPSRRPGRARTDGHQPLDVPQGRGAVERGRRARVPGARRYQSGEGHDDEEQAGAPTSHAGFVPTAP